MSRLKWMTRGIGVCVLALTTATAFGQSAVQRTAADTAAVSLAKGRFISAMAKGSSSGAAVKFRSDMGAIRGSAGGGGGGGVQYPGDLGVLFGGATISAAVQHPVYLVPNGSACNSPGCWGRISQFLTDLGGSSFMHITDQYVGASGGHRYTVGTSLTGRYPLVQPAFTDADMAAFAHAAARVLNVSGYGHIFHIFLAPEQNVCFDTSYSVCSSNSFCAYHGSAVFADIGEVVYTVEPNNANVFGCNQPAGSPNGAFDANYSVLSHELFETVTDPDGASWFNITNSASLGSEIGDECLFWLFDSTGNFVSANPVVQMFNGRAYAVQTEYNNAAHACTARPGSLN